MPWLCSSKTLDYSSHPRLALRAIGCADVRYGIPAFEVPLSRELRKRRLIEIS
jgi:hypothetical protein